MKSKLQSLSFSISLGPICDPSVALFLEVLLALINEVKCPFMNASMSKGSSMESLNQ